MMTPAGPARIYKAAKDKARIDKPGGIHTLRHWARRIRDLGHEVRLLPAKMVRPFVGGNKNDAHDARAIWTAVQQPGTKTVAIKSEE